jgi:glycosyltransferase involved in cell wall biosynthesis
MMQRVRIVIPCRNEADYIGACLDSIINASKENVQLSVYVVDGLSDDGTRDIIDSYTKIHSFITLHDNVRKTTPFALNIGIRSLDFDVAIILGAHAVIDPNFIDQNVSVLGEHSEVGCSGGIIRNVHENDWSEIISTAMSSTFGVGNAHFRTGGKSGYVDTVAFGAYRREVFERVGFFDEELARNQDDEFNFRVIRGGYKIFLDTSICSDYYVRASLSKLYRQYNQYGYWKVLVNRKHRAVTSIRQLAPPLWVIFVLSGWIGFFIHLYIGLFYLTMILAYLSLAIFTATRMRLGSWSRTMKLLQTFLALHFSYGLGYLKGLLHFYILNRRPAASSLNITR